jgi:dephospho-CoA kinase
MLLVGLTGGIGSGKSTVATMLAERGAVVIDADELARRAVARDTAGFRSVVDAFGDEVVGANGELDRAKLGSIVFADDERRRALEAVVHPEVARLFAREVDRHRDSDHVVVYAVPLLVERGLAPAFDVVVVVVASEEHRVERTVEARGLSADEVRARIAVQASDEDRAGVADVLLDNDGDRDRLERQVNTLWSDLARRAGAGS